MPTQAPLEKMELLIRKSVDNDHQFPETVAELEFLQEKHSGVTLAADLNVFVHSGSSKP